MHARACCRQGQISLLTLSQGNVPHPRPDQEHQATPTSVMTVFAQSDMHVPILPPPALLSAAHCRLCPRPLSPLPVPGRAGRLVGRGSTLTKPLLTARFFSMNGQTIS